MSKWINEYTIKITSASEGVALCAMNGLNGEDLPWAWVSGQEKTSVRSWHLSWVLHSEKAPANMGGGVEGRIF